ncbi:MAG: putative porin [Bacteroidota bacterium]
MFPVNLRFLFIQILVIFCFFNVVGYSQSSDTSSIRIDTVRSKSIRQKSSSKKSDSLALSFETEATSQSKLRKDSLFKHRDSTRVSYFHSNFEKLGKLILITNDTAIEGFQNYDPLFHNNSFFCTLGNIGQNYRTLTPVPWLTNSGFDYGIHSFDAYLYQNDSVKYYKVDKTYTELTYIQGAKKEQNFHAIFSRNLYRSLNLGFDLRVTNAPGAYSRQRTNHINFVLTSQFFTKNKRYGVIANFTINRIRNYENGGIKSDSLFVNNIETNRLVIPVNLLSAENRIREVGFFMKHYFDLTRHQSNSKDTVSGNSPGFDLGRLSYSFQYNRQIQNFIDNQPDSGFFPPPVLDSVISFDSVTIKQITNILTWSNPSFKIGMKPRIFQIEAGIKQQYTEVDLYGVRNSFHQYIPQAGISFTPFESLKLFATGDYVVGDYNEGDFHLQAKLISILGKAKKNGGIISITGCILSQQPGWFYAHYLGNNFQWDTTWQKQSLISTGFSYSLKYFETGFDISRIKNFIYLDSTSKPRQLTQEFGHFRVYFNTNADLWQFKLKMRLIYQTVQGTTVLRLPVFMGNVTIYYTQPLFHGAATLQPGLNFFYNTSYYADNYNPAIRSFYIQDNKEIGNYLYMDFFINMKIQRARFFVTYTHFNAGFMGRDYYTTPDYPMPDGAFKFGIAWRFHD